MLLGGLLFSAALFAQQINGSVQDAQGSSVNNATVSLLRSKDSSVVKLAVTKADGKFGFTGASAGQYLLSTSHIGHKPSYSHSFDFDGTKNVDVAVLKLEKLPAELKGITVTSKKPIVEVKADKTILNVEGTINATGNDALELLRK